MLKLRFCCISAHDAWTSNVTYFTVTSNSVFLGGARECEKGKNRKKGKTDQKCIRKTKIEIQQEKTPTIEKDTMRTLHRKHIGE
jgi:hypothetical protein